MIELCPRCQDLGECVPRGAGGCPSVPTPQTNQERQEAFRARNALLGRTEVRGIYLPTDMHAKLKETASRMMKKTVDKPGI
jgi:hypothetical protein